MAAFFDIGDISEYYFRAHYDSTVIVNHTRTPLPASTTTEWMHIFSTEGEWDSLRFGDTLAEFRRLSLIQVSDQSIGSQSSSQRRFSMHPLVRDWIRLRKNHAIQQKFVIEMIEALTKFLFSQKLDAWELPRQEIASLLDVCVRYNSDLLKNSKSEGLNVMPFSTYWFALFYQVKMLSFVKAENMFRRTLFAGDVSLGREWHLHPIRLKTLESLVVVLQELGNLHEAETLSGAILVAGINEVRGTNDASDDLTELVLHALDMRATIFDKLGEYGRAENWLLKLLNFCEEVCGPNDGYTLRAMIKMAHVYGEQHKFDEAYRMIERAHDRYEQSEESGGELLDLGEEFAMVEGLKGNHTLAEESLEMVLAKREEIQGSRHLDTLNSRVRLASVYASQHRYDEAEKLYRQVLEIYREKVGPHHPHTLSVAHHLATNFCDQGKYEEAETLHGLILATRWEELGRDHPDTINSMHGVANVCQNRGRYVDALGFYEVVLEFRQAKFGPTHRDTVRAVEDQRLCQSKMRPEDGVLPERAKMRIKIGLTGPFSSASDELAHHLFSAHI